MIKNMKHQPGMGPVPVPDSHTASRQKPYRQPKASGSQKKKHTSKKSRKTKKGKKGKNSKNFKKFKNSKKTKKGKTSKKSKKSKRSKKSRTSGGADSSDSLEVPKMLLDKLKTAIPEPPKTPFKDTGANVIEHYKDMVNIMEEYLSRRNVITKFVTGNDYKLNIQDCSNSNSNSNLSFDEKGDCQQDKIEIYNILSILCHNIFHNIQYATDVSPADKEKLMIEYMKRKIFFNKKAGAHEIKFGDTYGDESDEDESDVNLF